MRVCRSLADVRAALSGAPRPVGFVPTMGALHEGHAELVRRCREECATTVASVFVNPLQFDEPADLARYPRTLESDAERLESLGAALLFAPAGEDMYPEGFATSVDVGPLGDSYEGASRTGHFAGVATVVLKLFHGVAPDTAYFGRKDAQQVAVIRQLVRDLNLAIRLVAVETVRAPDGLALSSRNARLSAEERERTLGLPRGLFAGRDRFTAGDRDPDSIVAAARTAGLDYEYIAVVDELDFRSPRDGRVALLIAAIRMGATRLIDNVVLGPW